MSMDEGEIEETEEGVEEGEVEEATFAISRVEKKVDSGGPNHGVTGVSTSGDTDGAIELGIPNLLPTDNASEIREAKVRRVKIPVRIERLQVKCIDNGYMVDVANAGRMTMFGPDGSEHAFTGPNAKAEMLEFIGMVIGQVSYMYKEELKDDDGEEVNF